MTDVIGFVKSTKLLYYLSSCIEKAAGLNAVMAPADAGRRRYYAEVTRPLGPAQANKLRVHGRNLQELWQHRRDQNGRPSGGRSASPLLIRSATWAGNRKPETGNYGRTRRRR